MLRIGILEEAASKGDAGLTSRYSRTYNLKRVRGSDMVYEEKRSEEKTSDRLIDEMHRMLSSGNGKGMSSIEVPEALLPQFQLLMDLARLRKRGVPVGSLSRGNR